MGRHLNCGVQVVKLCIGRLIPNPDFAIIGDMKRKLYEKLLQWKKNQAKR